MRGHAIMPTPSQQANISNAIDAIRTAENLLSQQVRTATDSLTALKLTNEYNNLDTCLSQLLQAQNAVDDASFSNAAASLQSDASGLQADEATIKSIVGDVQVAANIISYITQALGIIAKL
jgi:ABC-type phosphate transport system auxiliary subunit